MTANPFVKAQRGAVAVKLGLIGPSGSGKTYTALRIARGIAGPTGRVALIDTEHGSASLYADQFEFDTVNMPPPYTPAIFADGIKAAAAAVYDVLIIDGISPAWNGPGGVMEIVDQGKLGNNQFSGWAKGSPAHQQLVQGILAAPMHLICTMRSKTAWVIGVNNKPERVGLEPVQREGIDYEFSVVGVLDVQHRLTVTKSRLRELAVDEVVTDPGEALGAALVLAVSAGAESPRPVDTRHEAVADSQADRGDGSSRGASAPDGDEAEAERAHTQRSTLDLSDPDRRKITKAQQTRLFAIARKEYKLSDETIRTVVHSLTGSRSTSDIERSQYDQVLADLKLAALAVPQ